ncbi:AAA family ATPase [Curtobacterium sp. P97]|uniref:AAA family ATPase n=1 Tax=Curtobacterium sp. P97 TaxID=2939562 RepID=UPI00203DC200|nr:AAA family ATPase [Curtobacterium sp. P97]MCM3522512.1 ATP-binding protein [Curtobacterium sp. P97]
MFALTRFNEGGLGFDLAPDSEVQGRRDRFTVVIGANGSGKSRLLRAIATSAMTYSRETNKAASSGPTRILAVSNLVSDSFPFEPRGTAGAYRYLGLRQASNNMSTGSLQDSILDSLLEYELESRSLATLSPVFQELGFDQWSIASSSRKRRLPLMKLSDLVAELDRFQAERAPTVAEEIVSTLNAAISTMQQTNKDHKPRLIGLLQDLRSTYNLPGALLVRTMRKATGATLRVVLQAQNQQKPADLLSAGQSMLLSMCTRIAANIHPESLVLVDEPETGLHPNWQSSFIPLLQSMFPNGTSSHFFIATHSPHLVADASDVLVPSETPGLFEEFDEPFYGRSPENVLYRVFGARVTGNLLVERDLTTVMSALSARSLRAFNPGSPTADALMRLRAIASSDTIVLNSIIAEVHNFVEDSK